MTPQVASSLKLSIVVVVLSLAVSKAQIGSECSETKTCYDHQNCYHGYCSCDRGYVRNDRHCFRVRSYGETCFFDVQCNDHRMVCEPDSTNTSVRRCLCDRMHVWSKERKECLMTLNITEMLASLELSEYSEKLSKEDQKVFVGVVIAGITVVILGAILTFICIFYGCCLYECVDKWQILETGEMPKQSKCGPSCPEFVKSTAPKSGFT
ncbi:uncharacterized protein LOC126210049 isoform X1 [Schistocerca nitens]|uniref:uncharacterized protein LOC126210049 isoform X1 n=1 Tax=Schistocerca nitens TaxID=7011 RepID=UPI0021198DBE|nr:uncharacterized protein LOC126210049 isoform X1 [Schistocerca nitens]XP_049795116.1 uncharacterized protein LOC126210049 isoform X1 [Schistocerca nitens]XP_049795117.1 uncharacterized protein LOC126210049 isoform X1 [Schistocerca nitens]XP_049795118.1 uncharacterized protein LOC126210049 isoform X1 [Schistocerca nitens]